MWQLIYFINEASDSLDLIGWTAQLGVEPVYCCGHDSRSHQVHDQTQARALTRSYKHIRNVGITLDSVIRTNLPAPNARENARSIGCSCSGEESTHLLQGIIENRRISEDAVYIQEQRICWVNLEPVG